MKAKDGLRDIISMTLLALMTVLVVFASVYTSSKKKASDGVQDIERDKVDCTILPSPSGKNPFTGRSWEIRTESTLWNLNFAVDGMLYLTEPCTLDKRLTVSLESKCEYTWDTETQELYVKPIAFKINDDYIPNSIQIKNHYKNLSLEILDALPYPWYSQDDRGTAALLLSDYFSILIESKLFEIERYSYDVQDYGLMLERIQDDVFADFVSFSPDEDDSETVLKLSRRQLVLSCPDDDSGNSVFYAGLPMFDSNGKVFATKLCRLFYEDSIQIESGSMVKLEILPQEIDQGNGMITLKLKVLDIPEESKITEGQILEGMVRSVGDLVWFNAK
ncbi:MAG: hypothetical protein J6Y69_00025 [Treponema sp.]|nr:hypothetical protein [Treponema sp.]